MKITITGLGGTGKSTVGKKLASFYNSNYMSGGSIFRLMAEQQGMTIEEFDAFVKRNNESFDRTLDTRQKQYGKEHTDFVFESRLGWYFIPDSFKIYLTCDLDERMRRISQDDASDRIAHQKSDFEETKKKTLAREATYDRYKDLYGIEKWNDEANFDYVINTTHISSDEVVSKIIDFVEKSEA